MADISKVKLPDNSEYNVKDLYRGCEFIRGTQTAATNVWTGTSADSELVDGKQILYFLPYAGTSSAATLNLTLANGTTTGAKAVYFQSTSRMTTHYGANQQFRLIYHKSFNIGGTNYEGWWSEPGRDTNDNTYDRNKYTGTIKCNASTAIASGNIIVGKDGVFHHLKEGTAFSVQYPILYAQSNIGISETGNNNYNIIALTVTTTQSISMTAYAPVYIKGTLSGFTFTPVSTAPLTQTVPSGVDNYCYMLLGVAYTATTLYMTDDHRIFKFMDGSFKVYEQTFAVNNNISNGTAVDLNNIKVPGFYNCGGNNSVTHVPSGLSGSAFGLEVIKDALGEYYTQIYYPLNSNVPYLRYCNNGTWSDWEDYTRRVRQTETTTANWRKIPLGSQSSTAGASIVEVTGQLYVTPSVEVQPTTGTLNANRLSIQQSAVMQYNSTNECIEFVFS